MRANGTARTHAISAASKEGRSSEVMRGRKKTVLYARMHAEKWFSVKM